MINLIMSKEWKNVSFVGDLSFGPRGQFQSIPNVLNPDGTDDPSSFNIQNLYVSYAVNDVLSFDMGYMGTFMGYEVISPVDNFNYSTSYLFTYGPFQNAGLKINVAPSDKVDFMVGLFNDVNSYSNTPGSSFDLGAQVHVAPTEGLDVYVNYLTSETGFDELDLTAGYQATDALYLGLNVAKQWASAGKAYFDNDSQNGFFGAALYVQYALSDAFGLGLRAEHFNESTNNNTNAIAPSIDDTSVNSFTLLGN
ncbi:MAG: outer membrane beta-barrel protein, partial [Cyclobacteriaceae bacterium]